jgi:hypothetical protein
MTALDDTIRLLNMRAPDADAVTLRVAAIVLLNRCQVPHLEIMIRGAPSAGKQLTLKLTEDERFPVQLVIGPIHPGDIRIGLKLVSADKEHPNPVAAGVRTGDMFSAEAPGQPVRLVSRKLFTNMLFDGAQSIGVYWRELPGPAG